jgi:hypothetical protein
LRGAERRGNLAFALLRFSFEKIREIREICGCLEKILVAAMPRCENPW